MHFYSDNQMKTNAILYFFIFVIQYIIAFASLQVVLQQDALGVFAVVDLQYLPQSLLCRH